MLLLHNYTDRPRLLWWESLEQQRVALLRVMQVFDLDLLGLSQGQPGDGVPSVVPQLMPSAASEVSFYQMQVSDA